MINTFGYILLKTNEDDSTFVTVFGLVAGIISALSTLPQLARTYKLKKSKPYFPCDDLCIIIRNLDVDRVWVYEKRHCHSCK